MGRPRLRQKQVNPTHCWSFQRFVCLSVCLSLSLSARFWDWGNIGRVLVWNQEVQVGTGHVTDKTHCLFHKSILYCGRGRHPYGSDNNQNDVIPEVGDKIPVYMKKLHLLKHRLGWQKCAYSDLQSRQNVHEDFFLAKCICYAGLQNTPGSETICNTETCEHCKWYRGDRVANLNKGTRNESSVGRQKSCW